MRAIDIVVLVAYFGAMSFMGVYFTRKSGTTEGYFVGNRSYPGWLIGISLFGATISSITFVAYPADAFRTSYLRLLLCFMLPVGVLIASRFFVPFFRRGKITSAFQYLEARYGPKTRVYAASVFIVAQCLRISMIQFLVAMLLHEMTGMSVMACILVGGAITAFYTVRGGIEAVIWTDFVQSIILTGGGLLILGVILYRLPGGLGQVLSMGAADHKFMFGDLDPAENVLRPAPLGFSLSEKTVVMMLLVGLFQWLAEYSSNQEVVQKYCAARTAQDARRAMWICCLFCVPTWAYFMFLGTCLYVFYKVFPDAQAQAMLSGVIKAEGILPHFVATELPAGLSGIVAAAVLAAAMSSMSSAMNSISAVSITDIYRRHIAPDRDDRHYVRAAKAVTLASALIMIGGAAALARSGSRTLQDMSTEFAAILGGGLLGLYMLGFFTTRGDGRAVGAGIALAVAFSALISFAGLGWLPERVTRFLDAHFETYYTGVVGNVLMFLTGYAIAALLPRSRATRERDLTNLTVYTQSSAPLD
ncbi:MAG: sodium/solute symporter [Candidatus Hydrogenedentes bacterium]|nr:sodium/solute symporter [Candidatus Hydrogenedentota bacterium]